MSTSKSGYKYLGKLIIRYLPLLVIILILTAIDSTT